VDKGRRAFREGARHRAAVQRACTTSAGPTATSSIRRRPSSTTKAIETDPDYVEAHPATPACCSTRRSGRVHSPVQYRVTAPQARYRPHPRRAAYRLKNCTAVDRGSATPSPCASQPTPTSGWPSLPTPPVNESRNEYAGISGSAISSRAAGRLLRARVPDRVRPQARQQQRLEGNAQPGYWHVRELEQDEPFDSAIEYCTKALVCDPRTLFTTCSAFPT
jgi:hypothetical protein